MTESLEQEIQTLRSLFWSERDPDGRGFVPLADAYRRAGDARQAMELLTDGLARHPEFAPAHVVAARLYVEQGMVEEGEMAARKALDLDSENVVALGALLRVLEERGRGEEAAEVRDRLLTLDPGALGGDDAAPEASPGEALPDGEPEGVEYAGFAIEAPDGTDASQEGPDAALEEAPEAEAADAGGGLIDISGMTGFELGGITIADEGEPSGSTLAPDPEPPVPADAIDISTLAPEPEPPVPADAIDISTLAPDPEPEAAGVVDVSTLAPDPEAEMADVVDISTLAPDPELEAADAIDISTLAPDPEPEMADVVDISSLSPDPDSDALDIALLAPDPEPEMADVVDISTLAPDPDLDALDIALLAPDPDETEAPDTTADADADGDEPDDIEETGPGGAPIYTRTLAELYVKQGFTDRAIEVLRNLQRNAPQDESLRRRIEELEAGQVVAEESPPRAAPPRRLPGGPEAAALVREAEEEVEASARDLAESGDGHHDVDTPFAWTEQEAEDAGEQRQASIREYFEGLLTWRSREGS